MFFHQDATIESVFVHHVGNKTHDEFYSLSDQPIDLESDDLLPNFLMRYYTKPFAKAREVYRFYHQNAVDLNEVYNFATQYFEGLISRQTLSEQLAKHLYDVSYHPKVKSGELHVVFFKGVQMEGEEHDAIGIFKTENKDTVLKLVPTQEGYQLDYILDTVNLDKLDKGAIIVNTEAEEGYKVLIVDSGTVADAVYWKDDFLKVIARNDNFQQTSNLMKTTKNFVLEKMDDFFELTMPDKADLLNRSIQYFEKHESYNAEEFEQDVFGNEIAISQFQDYKREFEEEFETPMESQFAISAPAVKKLKTSFKKIIKLDKNAHIYLHGSRDILERGYDEEKGKNFYKVYFENEG